MSDNVIIIDVSHHQGKIDWKEVKLSGVEAVYIKCTNGSNNTDDMYRYNSSEAKKNGIKIGAYHFMLSQQNPDLQADNFISNVGAMDLIPVVDMEWDFKNNIDRWKSVTLNARIAMLGRFIRKVQNKLNTTPMIYTNRHWWAQMFGANREYNEIIFNECPLWLADYSTISDTALNCPPWPEFTLRQFSERLHVNGINTVVDGNRLKEGKTLNSLLLH